MRHAREALVDAAGPLAVPATQRLWRCGPVKKVVVSNPVFLDFQT